CRGPAPPLPTFLPGRECGRAPAPGHRPRSLHLARDRGGPRGLADRAERARPWQHLPARAAARPDARRGLARDLVPVTEAAHRLDRHVVGPLGVELAPEVTD